MENFKMWLDEFKYGSQFDFKKESKAREELETMYGILVLQNEQLKEEVEDLKCRLEI